MAIRSIAVFLLCLFLGSPLFAQQLVPSKLVVAKEFQSLFTTEHTVWLPAGFRMNVFAAGKIAGPRFMQFDPQGNLCVALTDYSTVVMLPDEGHGGVADSIVLLAEVTGP